MLAKCCQIPNGKLYILNQKQKPSCMKLLWVFRSDYISFIARRKPRSETAYRIELKSAVFDGAAKKLFM